MKLAAIIVTYLPNIQFLLENISLLIDDVDQLIIYRNSELQEDILPISGKIVLLGNGENLGIARALNEAIKWIEKQGTFTHILTLDQDSSFFPLHLEKFKEFIISKNRGNIGIFCPNIDNRGFLSHPSNEEYIVVNDSITSGSIFPIETFKICGMFDEELFIDAVDYEYCYRIFQKYELITIIFPSIHLKHEVGYPTKIKFGLLTDNYSAFRTYFIIRNHIIIWKRYPNLFQPSYKKTLIKIHILYRFAKVIIGEEDKLNKLKAIFKGLLHGLSRK